jgi:hypothetical protein
MVIDMKKYMLFLTCCSIFLLASCVKEDPIIDDEDPVDNVVECTTDQIKQGDQCIDLTGSEIQLRNAIEQSKNLDNYKIVVTISEGENIQEMSLYVDDSMSMLQTANQTDYYRVSGAICEHKIESNGVSTTTEVSCDTQSNLLLLQSIDYTMFILESGAYHLKDSERPIIEASLEPFFSDISLDDVTISIADNRISFVTYYITVDALEMVLQMEYTDIDQVELTWGDAS